MSGFITVAKILAKQLRVEPLTSCAGGDCSSRASCRPGPV